MAIYGAGPTFAEHWQGWLTEWSRHWTAPGARALIWMGAGVGLAAGLVRRRAGRSLMIEKRRAR